MLPKRLFLTASLAALIVACGDEDSPAGSLAAPGASSISDAVHSGGNEHFFFLLPMVRQPSFSGTFDPSLAPSVDICEWSDAVCATVVATFTITGGSGSETIRVVPEDELYAVR